MSPSRLFAAAAAALLLASGCTLLVGDRRYDSGELDAGGRARDAGAGELDQAHELEQHQPDASEAPDRMIAPIECTAGQMRECVGPGGLTSTCGPSGQWGACG